MQEDTLRSYTTEQLTQILHSMCHYLKDRMPRGVVEIVVNAAVGTAGKATLGYVSEKIAQSV